MESNCGGVQGSSRTVIPEEEEEEEERRADFFISLDILLRYAGLGLQCIAKNV